MEKRESSFLELFKLFPNLIDTHLIQQADMEFREIRNMNFKDIFGEDINVNVTDFWKLILSKKRCDGSFALSIMESFIFNLLSLPNSSANVERTFSQINVNKTKSRNKLKLETLEGILLTKDYLRMKNYNCFDLQIEKDIISQFNANMYL